MSASQDTILVTGSSGLIGAAVVERLAGRFNVVACDRIPPARLPPAATHVDVDFGSDESVAAALAGVRRSHGDRLASVVHLAAYYDFSGEPSPLYEEVTVRGTERLLRGLGDLRPEQLLFSSTMLVHAPCAPGQRIDEDWPLDPKWDYPQSKAATERLVREQRGAVPVALLRIAGVYDGWCHSIPIAHQIQRIYERQLTSRVYPGDISRGQSFLHLLDLVDAIERLVDRRADVPPELPLLLGEEETLSYDELQRMIGQLVHGEPWETRSIPKPLAKAGAWLQDAVPGGEEPFIKPWMVDLADDHYALDIARAKRLLGWEPQHSLRATLPEMIGHLLADPGAWYRENKLGQPAAVAAAASAR